MGHRWGTRPGIFGAGSIASVSISSDDVTDSTEELDSKYDLEHHPDGDMFMEDDVDALYGIHLDGDLDMERDGDDEEEEDEGKEDEEEEEEEEEDEEVEEEEEEEEDEVEDEDDGKKTRTFGQGEMVNTSADDVDTMVDNQPLVLPEH